MRFFKALTRFKLIKGANDIDALIEEFANNYAKMGREQIEAFAAQIVAIASEEMSEEALKELIEHKLDTMQLNLNARDLEPLYIAMAQKTGAELKNAAKKAGKQLAYSWSFDTADLETIKAMQNGFYWFGNEYSKEVADKIKEAIKERLGGAVKPEDSGARLKELISEVKTLSEEILDASEKYFQMVADNIALQAQNVARVSEGEKYGVKYYKVVAIMDERTSPICRSMNGRIIGAAHLEAQAKKITGANSMAQKKAASPWQSKAYNGKTSDLPDDLGTPPYHPHCRTRLVPVWIDEYESEDGVKMKASEKPREGEVLRHIDKTGTERTLKKSNSHVFKKHKESEAKNIVKALNSINTTAKNAKSNRLNAWSDNGYFIVFDGDKIVTAFKPEGSKKAGFSYFKKASEWEEKEVIKWRIENLL